MRVVSGPIQRIDDPLPLALPAADELRLARFFGEYSVLRIVRTNTLDDQIFRGDVGFGDEIDVALARDLRGAELLDQQVACVTGDLSGS